MECRLAASDEEREAAFRLRVEVFVEEQGCPLDEEVDEYDAAADHLVALLDGAMVGTARVYEAEGKAKIGRVAVRRDLRGTGIGGILMEAARARALESGYGECVLHAQLPVVGFYERLGYTAEGEVFYEAGIPHVRMTRAL